MWKKLKTSKYFITFSSEYEVYVTDYVSIWCAYYTKINFIRCLKDSNKFLEMSEDALLHKAQQVFLNPESIKTLDTKLDATSLVINITMQFGYPFKLNLILCKGSNELFFNKVTQPLLKTVLELKNSQLELCQLLKKKDSEIEEYKCEGGEIAIKHLKTKAFNESELLSKYKSFQEHFGATNDLIGDLIQTVLETPENKKKNEVGTGINTTKPIKVKIEVSETRSVKQEYLPHNSMVKDEGVPHIKIEPNSQNVVTDEPPSQIADNSSLPSVSATINLKHESGLPIKRESQSIPVIRKKTKKLF